MSAVVAIRSDFRGGAILDVDESPVRESSHVLKAGFETTVFSVIELCASCA